MEMKIKILVLKEHNTTLFLFIFRNGNIIFFIKEVSGIYIGIASFKNRFHIQSTEINYDQSTHFQSCSICKQ